MEKTAVTAKIVFLGAGSMSFGLSMYKDMFTTTELDGCTLTLVDTNPDALGRMAELARLMNARSGAGLRIEHTTDRRAALVGASFVVNAVAIDRNRLWKHDFDVPKKFGIRQTMGENGGPGGLFFTMRTLPMIMDFARDMEELCPDALLINLSNPDSRILLALAKYSRIRAVGLCHGIFMGQGAVAHIMGMRWEEVEVWGAGLNHFQCLMHIRDRRTGKDLYPLLREKAETFDPTFNPLTRRLLRAFGYWLTCSDDHMGEYVPYGWEGGEQGPDLVADEQGRLEAKTTLDGVLAGTIPMPADWLKSAGELAVPLIRGVLHNQKKFLEAGIVYNQGVIPNLPADLAVEVPVVADRTGIHPVSLGPLPDPIAKLLSVQASVQQLAVEAAMRGSKELALQALLIDPVVNSTIAAAGILEELWQVNAPYIRNCL
jgi:alpha-galactosidase